MEIAQVGQFVQNFGAMAVIALAVFKSPAIIEQLSNLVQKIVSNVRDTQTEGLNVFKVEQDKLLSLIASQFTSMNTTIGSAVDELRVMATELSKLSNRVEHLERDKPG